MYHNDKKYALTNCVLLDGSEHMEPQTGKAVCIDGEKINEIVDAQHIPAGYEAVDLGGKYVIVGHSERRAMFGETDAIVNKKVHAALNAGLNPIICVGESLAQREMGVTMELIALQVKSALAGVSAEQMRRCVIAYEPIWAIGTGKTATGEQAAEVCTYIRSLIRAQYGARIARSVTIQYGGSMKGSNAHELLSHEDIDGGLIGGASLDPKALMEIVHAANQE